MMMPPSFAEILVDGPDALSFVHGQLAGDIKAIAHGHWRFAAYCVPDGRVQALMMVAVNAATRLRLLLPEELAGTVQDRLRRYRLRARCEIAGRSVQIARCGPTGPGALADNHCVYQSDAFQWQLCNAESTPLDASIWSDQVALGIPWIVSATSEKFLPQMLSLEQLGAFSLRKGCFPGQEIVARTHFLGRSKRHLATLTRTAGSDPLAPGCELLSTINTSVTAGWIIADGHPELPLALAVVTDSASETLCSGVASQDSRATFVINRESTETKRDKLLNGRCLLPLQT
ncbi:MAG: hypothetical protein R3F18_15865 [Lysobacterales bacterium]